MFDHLVEFFLQLVAIDSPSGQEEEIRSFVLAKFEEAGVPTFQDAYGNVLACVNCTDHPPIVFGCHLDTVGKAAGAKPVRTETGIHTDGTTALGADDKVAVALSLLLLEQRSQFGSFGLLFTVEEEQGLKGARNLGRELVDQLSLVYVFDTGKPVGTAIIQAPCKLDVHIDFLGKAAHAGVSPENGVSAISLASSAISQMKLLRIDEETTANIGSIHGDGSTNVVCDLVSVHMEIRSLQRAKAFSELEQARACCVAACTTGGGTFKLESDVSYEGYRIMDALSLSTFQACCKDIGLVSNAISTGGGSDVNILRNKGLDALLLGAGYTGGHSVQEKITFSEMEKMLQVALQLLKATVS